jgi:hypothetical protein
MLPAQPHISVRITGTTSVALGLFGLKGFWRKNEGIFKWGESFIFLPKFPSI